MSNPTAPTTPLTLKGVDYKLLFNFQAVADAEEVVGRSLITGLRKKDFEAPGVRLVQSMLFACMKPHHPLMTFEHAKTLVTLKNIGKVWSAVTDAWAEAMNEPDEDQAQGEDPGQS